MLDESSESRPDCKNKYNRRLQHGLGPHKISQKIQVQNKGFIHPVLNFRFTIITVLPNRPNINPTVSGTGGQRPKTPPSPE